MVNIRIISHRNQCYTYNNEYQSETSQKTPNEIALTILLAGFTLVFVIVCVTLIPMADYTNIAHPGTYKLCIRDRDCAARAISLSGLQQAERRVRRKQH